MDRTVQLVLRQQKKLHIRHTGTQMDYMQLCTPTQLSTWKCYWKKSDGFCIKNMVKITRVSVAVSINLAVIKRRCVCVWVVVGELAHIAKIGLLCIRSFFYEFSPRGTKKATKNRRPDLELTFIRQKWKKVYSIIAIHSEKYQ